MDAQPRVALVCVPDSGGASPLPHAAWLEALRQAPAVIEAVCVVGHLEIAQEACHVLGGRWPFADLEDLLRDARFDLGIVHAPTAERAATVKLLLQGRRHALCLGLPADGPDLLDRIRRAADKATRQVFLPWRWRFSPAFAKARELILSKRIGPVSGAVFSVCLSPTSHRVATLADSDLPIDADVLAESVDVLTHLIGPPSELVARATPLGVLSCIMTTADGVLVSLTLQHSARPELDGSRLDIRTEDGTLLEIEDGCRLLARNSSVPLMQHRPSLLAGSSTRIELGYAGLLLEVLTALHPRRNHACGLDLAQAQPAIVVLDAIRRSASKGKSVHLDD